MYNIYHVLNVTKSFNTCLIQEFWEAETMYSPYGGNWGIRRLHSLFEITQWVSADICHQHESSGCQARLLSSATTLLHCQGVSNSGWQLSPGSAGYRDLRFSLKFCFHLLIMPPHLLAAMNTWQNDYLESILFHFLQHYLALNNYNMGDHHTWGCGVSDPWSSSNLLFVFSLQLFSELSEIPPLFMDSIESLFAYLKKECGF